MEPVSERLRQCLQPGLVARSGDNPVAIVDQLATDRFADTTTCSGHQRHRLARFVFIHSCVTSSDLIACSSFSICRVEMPAEKRATC